MNDAYVQFNSSGYLQYRGNFKGLRRNPHRACYTKKRKSEKLRNRDRWERNNQPWFGGDYVR